jgi:hypothetical protein
MWLPAVREDGGDIVRVELWKEPHLRDEIPGEPIDGDLAAFRARTCPFDRPDDDRRTWSWVAIISRGSSANVSSVMSPSFVR